MLKSHQFACVLSLMLALAHTGSADARPSSSSSSHSSSSHSSSSRSSSSSFKSGFSSQRSSSAPSYASSKSSAAPASSGGFGSFGRRPASAAGSSNDGPGGTADAAPAPSRSSGGFGSFGGGRPAPQKSDSALSQQLGNKAAEANALRTLDARRQAQADAARDTRPVPGYEQGRQGQGAPGYGPMPQQQAPVVVRQDSGLGHVVAGAVLANAMRGAHANNGGYPGNYGNTGGYGNAGSHAGHGGGTSFLGLFMTLCVLALLAWGVYFMWRRLRRARDAKKPNYSFKEN